MANSGQHLKGLISQAYRVYKSNQFLHAIQLYEQIIGEMTEQGQAHRCDSYYRNLFYCHVALHQWSDASKALTSIRNQADLRVQISWAHYYEQINNLHAANTICKQIEGILERVSPNNRAGLSHGLRIVKWAMLAKSGKAQEMVAEILAVEATLPTDECLAAFNLASKYVKRGSPQQAAVIKMLTKALKDFPGNKLDIHLLLTRQLRYEAQSKSMLCKLALKKHKSILKDYPNYFPNYLEYAFALFQLGRYKASNEICQKLLHYQGPSKPSREQLYHAYRGVAENFSALGNLNRANAYRQKATDLKKKEKLVIVEPTDFWNVTPECWRLDSQELKVEVVLPLSHRQITGALAEEQKKSPKSPSSQTDTPVPTSNAFEWLSDRFEEEPVSLSAYIKKHPLVRKELKANEEMLSQTEAEPMTVPVI